MVGAQDRPAGLDDGIAGHRDRAATRPAAGGTAGRVLVFPVKHHAARFRLAGDAVVGGDEQALVVTGRVIDQLAGADPAVQGIASHRADLLTMVITGGAGDIDIARSGFRIRAFPAQQVAVGLVDPEQHQPQLFFLGGRQQHLQLRVLARHERSPEFATGGHVAGAVGAAHELAAGVGEIKRSARGQVEIADADIDRQRSRCHNLKPPQALAVIHVEPLTERAWFGATRAQLDGVADRIAQRLALAGQRILEPGLGRVQAGQQQGAVASARGQAEAKIGCAIRAGCQGLESERLAKQENGSECECVTRAHDFITPDLGLRQRIHLRPRRLAR